MNIIRGKIKTAKKVVIYGPEGIGKTTFAAHFPNPLFIDTEGSTKELDVARMDKPSSWAFLNEQVDFVIKNKPCKTLIIDTVDWAETLCIKDLCERNGKKGIEDFGYGKGYVYEKEDFGKFLNKLSDVISAGINVVLTAHACIRKFEQPDELGSYDRYEMKLGQKTGSAISPLVKEWADMVLFANYKTLSVATDKDGKKHKAQGGRRVMFTSHHPCWDAKNRYGLPDEIPMDYEQIKHIFEDTSPAEEISKPEVQTPYIEKPDLSAQKQTPVQDEKKAVEKNNGLPKPLLDLMAADNISEEDIRLAVSDKGYFPYDMPVKDYPEDFINGVLIAAWKDVKAMIDDLNGSYPF